MTANSGRKRAKTVREREEKRAARRDWRKKTRGGANGMEGSQKKDLRGVGLHQSNQVTK
jgi:hypothetical protein